eukprot:2732204-Rhodomonas_salina.1
MVLATCCVVLSWGTALYWATVWCYAASSTEQEYDATQRVLLSFRTCCTVVLSWGIVLPICYAMSGTELRYGATSAHEP